MLYIYIYIYTYIYTYTYIYCALPTSGKISLFTPPPVVSEVGKARAAHADRAPQLSSESVVFKLSRAR